MKKLLIIGTSRELLLEPPTIAEYTQNAIDSPDAQVDYCRIDQVVYIVAPGVQRIINGVTGGDIADYDVVWLRGRLALKSHGITTIGDYLAQHGVTVKNSFYVGRGAVGKLAQMFVLAQAGLPLPKTVIASSDYMAQYLGAELGYPAIVKDCYGAHGEQNYLVRDQDELEKILADNPEVKFMAQEYIKGVGDYRVLIAGDKQLIIHRVGSNDSHLNNTSQGASANLIAEAEFPAQILSDARKFAELQQYEISGVDAIIDESTGQHYFLEINSQPQVETGAFVAEKRLLIGGYFRDLLGL